ncbi:hypothetical protein R3Q06_11120 [Rhodococcus erythropolis]|uniref:hypothetical protein n=1 Tax=Rhodococcus erythropolis TaxID=1833 RepID=UPI00294971A5|nr:hypothetical protein [Rhodococcus erythropolis]MDV6274050.1 hypothetical protein [Rhodococcus erythropolis]
MTVIGDIFEKAFTLGYKTGYDYALRGGRQLAAEPSVQSAGGDCFDVCEGNPAPAEPAETDWQTVEAIPEGVEFRGTFSDGDLTETVWVKCDSIIWHSRPGVSHKEPFSIRPYAPFVAADLEEPS